MGGHEDRRTLATWQIISIWWNHRFWWTHSAFNQRIYQPINKYSSWPFYVCVNAIAGHTISSGADAALVAINAFYIPFSAISTQFGIRLRNEWCKRNNKDEKKNFIGFTNAIDFYVIPRRYSSVRRRVCVLDGLRFVHCHWPGQPCHSTQSQASSRAREYNTLICTCEFNDYWR